MISNLKQQSPPVHRSSLGLDRGYGSKNFPPINIEGLKEVTGTSAFIQPNSQGRPSEMVVLSSSPTQNQSNLKDQEKEEPSPSITDLQDRLFTAMEDALLLSYLDDEHIAQATQHQDTSLIRGSDRLQVPATADKSADNQRLSSISKNLQMLN